MTILEKAQRLIAQGDVPPYLIGQVSIMVNELADLKVAIMKAELKLKTARSANEKLGSLSHWKDLKKMQADIAIDLTDTLNLPE